MKRTILACFVAALVTCGAVTVHADAVEKSEISLAEIQSMTGFYTESVQP